MNKRRGTNISNDRGFALLIVLWSSVLLALFATSIAATGRTETQLASNLRNAAITEAAADGAIYRSISRILTGDGQGSPIGHDRLSAQNVTIDVRTEDLAGRINPSVVPPEMLRALLGQLGIARQQAAALTDAVKDWTTPGQRARPQGAKSPEYRAAGRTYAPPGEPLRNIDELGLVLGITPELLAVLKPHLTTWWDNDPDPAAAGPATSAALRELGADERPSAGETPGQVQVIDIIADAAGPAGSRFLRHAVVKIGPTRHGERTWRLLEWSTVP